MEDKNQVMHPFKDKKQSPAGQAIIILCVVALLGIGSGFGLAQFFSASGNKNMLPAALNPNAPAKGKVFGSDDTKTFKDTAEGVVKEGGIEGEGQYHLVRPGGDSQNVYMTSSLVDLSQFINKKVKVWGETQKAQKAGWLMDVGRVEVL